MNAMTNSPVTTPTWRTTVAPVGVGLLLAMAVGSLLMLASGRPPGAVWLAMITRAFGDSYSVGQILYRATTLVLTGLAVTIALDAGLFSLAGESQIALATLAVAAVGAHVPAATSPIVAIALGLAVASAAGALLGAALGLLRVFRHAHEVLVAIMLNAIVASFALWLGNSYLFERGTMRGPTLPGCITLPSLHIGASPANLMLVVAIVVAAVWWWVRAHSRLGLLIQLVGQAPEVARLIGVRVGAVRIGVLMVSGALAGLVAGNVVLGHQHAYEYGLARGAGYWGIAVALIGQRHPAGIAGAASVVAWLQVGGLSVADIVPKELAEVLIAVVILAMAVAQPLMQRLQAHASRHQPVPHDAATSDPVKPPTAPPSEET